MTLGQSRVIRDGQPVMVSDWRSDKARALFLYLLFTGGNSREQISLAFWPDSAIQRVRSNFHTTLYRARQAVGDNVIVFQDERYQINPQIDLWCDAQEFAGLTQKASLLSPHNAQTDDLWRRAIDLYTGEFLPALDGEWIIGYRESCAEAYLSALIGRGRCAYARQHFTQAIGYYQQALAHDPYREDVYRAMMRCHAETGERSLVLTCWQQLQGVLQNDLALPPSRETTILAEALLR
jgi:DNA-binding SARP family transcriptional activator